MANTTWVVGRDCVLLDAHLRVADARDRFEQANQQYGTRYAIVVDSHGAPLTSLRLEDLNTWDDTAPLVALRDEWPALYVLPADQARDASVVRRLFGAALSADTRAAGVVLLDTAGKPVAVLGRAAIFGESAVLGDAGSQPTTRRYGHIDFPAEVPLNVQAQLIVSINRAARAGDAELDLSTSGGWPLQVVATLVNVQPGDFVVDGPTSQVLEVPQDGDSAPAVFLLTPQSSGPKTIRIRFEQANCFLNTARVSTTVVEGVVKAGSAQIEFTPAVAVGTSPPDFTILIEQTAGLSYSVAVVSRSDDPTAPAQLIDTITFTSAPLAYMQEHFAFLNRAPSNTLPADEFDKKVRQLGNSLFDSLFKGDGFATFYWQQMYPLAQQTVVRAGVSEPYAPTVQIVSDEPHIPWELLRPYRRRADGTIENETAYFCERFALARWLAPAPGAAQHLTLERATLVVPPSNLQFVKQEADGLKQFASAAQMQLDLIETKAALEAFLEQGSAQVLHFACHGQFDDETPERSAVIFTNTSRLLSAELTGESLNFGRFKPLVFLNCCETGRLGMGMTGMAGWAEAFVRKAGVGFFIGSIWKANDELAASFALAFYERLRGGSSVAEALRQARLAVRRPGNATHLSYTLYAAPQAGV